jgi:alkylation response protein AidB-like acyl-CoA dehydrogenase
MLELKLQRDRMTVAGTLPLVAGAGAADLVMGFASYRDVGLVAVLIPRSADGVSIRPRPALGGEPVYEVRFDRVAVDEDSVLGFDLRGSDLTRAWEEWFNQSLAIHCMGMAGSAAMVLEMTAGYMLRRQQFGRVLGSFQAVQHHLANLAILVDGAYATALQALWKVANRADAGRATSIAKIWCSRASQSITVLAHQLHGGIGYVRESDLHLWSERAVADVLSMGSTDLHLGRIWSAIESDGTADAVRPKHLHKGAIRDFQQY